MKAVLSAVLAIVLCSCAGGINTETTKEETVGVWITYSEIENMVLSEEGFEAQFQTAVNKCKELGINTVFFHTVAFCDAVYPSSIYPYAQSLRNTRSDVLKTAVDIAHRNSLKLHAWINPYRVSTSTADLNALSPEYFESGIAECFETEHICFTESGIYLNPSSALVRSKITAGIREIINGYEVDGIHFDDYFYPTADIGFDSLSFEKYKQGENAFLEIDEWRRVNVNSLIMGVYSLVKAKNKDLLFGISPAADMDKNYNTLFADVEGWLGGGYVDYIIPQLYFGFQYPDERFRFDSLLTRWLDICGSKADLYIGLASYKSGTETPPDNAEWQSDNTVLAKEIELLRQNGVNGFVFFSYSSLFSNNLHNSEQLKYIKEVI